MCFLVDKATNVTRLALSMNSTFWMDASVTGLLTYSIRFLVCLQIFKLIEILGKVCQSGGTVLMRKCVDVKPQRFNLWWDIDTIFMYFWLIDSLCCRGLQRWLGAARHSTITRSDCEISANSSVGLGASLSLAPPNNVTQMPFLSPCELQMISILQRAAGGKGRMEKWGQPASSVRAGNTASLERHGVTISRVVP